MNSPGRKVRELAIINALLQEIECTHFNYEDVLKHLRLTLAPPPPKITPLPNISDLEEQTIEELLEQVFFPTPKVNRDIQCNGCKYAILIREVLVKRELTESIIGPLSRALSSGQFENLKIDSITLNP